MLSLQVHPRRGLVLRAALATVEITMALIAAHTWAGGELPSRAWMAGAAALVFAGGAVVLCRRMPLRVMVPKSACGPPSSTTRW